jgi:flagellar biosynthesis protein FlhF
MIKKYRAASFSEAKQQIKEELGPDAILLNFQELKRSSNPNEKVEITATLDDTAEVPQNNMVAGTYNNKGAKPIEWRNLKPEKPLKPSEKNQLEESVSKLADCMESTIAEIKALREEFAATRNEFLEGVRVVRERIPKEFSYIASVLSKNGLQPQTVQDLLAETMLLCPASSRDGISVKEQMKKALVNKIFIASRPRLRKGRPLIQMFIGPAGSGKSGIISKLAGRATVTGNASIAIVTTDCYRMGALEQMEAFTAAADIDLEKISSAEEVPEVFGRLREKSLVLIDTAGRSIKKEEHEKELTMLYETIRPDEVHLVLPINMRDKDLEKSVEQYAAIKVNRIVFTKLDETSEPGALLWLPVKFGIPLSYIGNGQSPDSIVSAEKEIIAEWLLKEEHNGT